MSIFTFKKIIRNYINAKKHRYTTSRDKQKKPSPRGEGGAGRDGEGGLYSKTVTEFP